MPERRRFPDPLHPLKEVFKFAVRFVEANRLPSESETPHSGLFRLLKFEGRAT